MFKLSYYVPESHLEATKEAVFEAGAGRVGQYDRCCWQVQGEGQFRPLPGSRPFIGEAGITEQVTEYRVEMVCSDESANDVVTALKAAHPYEQPAYDLIRVIEAAG